MATFDFRFTPAYRVLAAPFGVTPTTTAIAVDAEAFDARFGPWHVTTPVSNIESCEESGPFTLPKTVGPAHLSLSDRGLTFATNPDRGLCIRFAEPVAGIDPMGLIRHPALTVTPESPEDLIDAIDAARGGTEPRARADAWPAESPWSVLGRWARWPLGMVLATGRYALATTQVDRRFTDAGPVGDAGSQERGHLVQAVEDGVGPLYVRTYRVRVRGSELEPDELIDRLVDDLNVASPTEVAEFEEQRASGPGADGQEYAVKMPGPWRARVRLVEREATSFRLVTLRGHMEAGTIDFRAGWDDGARGGDRTMVFEIRSAARSGGTLFHLLYDRLPIAREMQLHMWLHFCRRVARITAGQVDGKPQVSTVRHRH